MLTSSRFAVAVHALVVLARSGDHGPVCSTVIATSVNTNPVVIRRLMAELERAGLVHSYAGRSGGFELKRPPIDISLSDIYDAVEDANVFRLHKIDPHSDCPVGAQLAKALSPALKAAETAMSLSLKGTSLDAVAQSIH